MSESRQGEEAFSQFVCEDEDGELNNSCMPSFACLKCAGFAEKIK